MDLNAPQILKVENYENEKGFTSVLEEALGTHFEVERIYYLSNSKLASRGSHGHKKLAQIFLSLTGNHILKLTDGLDEFEFELKENADAVYVPPGFWREIVELNEHSKVLVLANMKYDPTDYLPTYEEFLEWKKI